MSELMSQMSAALRARHYSRRTEQAYRLWVRRFIRFHGIRHPVDTAEPEINAFVTHLAVGEQVSASSQTRALSGNLFLYRHVIGREVGELTGLVRARTSRRLPVVLTRDEVKAVLSELDGDRWLMAALMYGAGLRLMPAPARPRPRAHARRDRGARRRGRQGPRHDAATHAHDRRPSLSSRRGEPSTSATSPPAGAASRGRRPLRASTQTPRPTGAGSGSSRRSDAGRIRRRARRAAITSTRPSPSGP